MATTWPQNSDHTLQRDIILQIIRMCVLICYRRHIQILAHLINNIHELNNMVSNENLKVTEKEFLMHVNKKNLSTL